MATPFSAGSKPTASELNSWLPIFAYKTINQDTGANNTTLGNDSALFVTGTAGYIYTVETHFEVSGAGSSTAGNIKFAWTFPTGGGQQLTWSGEGMAVNDISGTTAEGRNSHLAVLTTSSPSASVVFGTPLTNFVGIVGRGLWIVGSTGGTLQLQWAQSVNSATASVVRSGSWVRLTRVQ